MNFDNSEQFSLTDDLGIEQQTDLNSSWKENF